MGLENNLVSLIPFLIFLKGGIQFIMENEMSSFMFDDIDCLSDIYVLERFHYGVVKDSYRVRHMEIVREDYEIVTEAASDVLQKMADFFKKMLNAIKEFFKKVFMYIASYFMDIDKFVKTYKKDLDKITKIDFTIRGYKFTLDKKPNLSPIEEVINDYNNSLAELGKMKKDDILKKQRDFLDSANLRRLRAEIVGMDNVPGDFDDYPEEVRKIYRDGEASDIEIKVDMTKFRETINGTEKLVKDKKEAEKIRDKTDAILSRAQTFFSRQANIVYKDKNKSIASDKLHLDTAKGELKTGDINERAYTSEGKLEIVNAFMRYKYNQSHELAVIMNIVVREYSNAYKDAVKMTREIIRKGLMNPTEDADAEAAAKKED